jgi:hypothetical protein
MKKFTLAVFLGACILAFSGITSAQNVVDLSGIDNPYVLQDTLPSVASESIILLKPGMTYMDSIGYAFDKSIEFRSSDPNSMDLPMIDCSKNFNLVPDANVDFIRFQNIGFYNGLDGFDNRYVFNIDESGTIGEVTFESCNIRSLRGIMRLKDGTGSLGKFTVTDCVVDSIKNYGVLYVDKDSWEAGDILLENSTFSRIQYFLASRSNSKSLTIESCTLNEVPDVGRQMFRWRGGDGMNDITEGLTISNTIWGPGWDMEAEDKTGVKGYEGLPNTTLNFQNTYATVDFLFSSDTLVGFPNVTYSGTATELWVDPMNGDYTILDPTFAGKDNAGDPRWRTQMEGGSEWNFSDANFNALGEITETTTVDGLTIYANSEKSVTIDENNKSLDGTDYTHRLKLGGSGAFDDSGMPTGRVLAFDVTGNTTITVIGMSSSSSADRELVIAVDSMNNELGRFPALGESISKGEFNYMGGAATIYLFSPSSGVNLYHVKTAPYAEELPDIQEWNISMDAFNGLGEMTETVTVEGLTIHANTEKSVTVDENNKSLGGMDFTHRLKFGGSGAFDEFGMPVARVVSFKVPGNSNITVMGMSSSSSADRELVIAAGTKDNEIARFPALGESISEGIYMYSGEATTIYMYSPSSGVNMYYIKAEKVATSAITYDAPAFKVYPNPAKDKIFVDVNEPTEIGVFSISGNLLIRRLVNSSMDFINVSGLPSGMYFVKSLKQGGNAQKIIIQ